MHSLSKLLISYETGINVRKNKLHCGFFLFYFDFLFSFFSSRFPGTIWHLHCITDIVTQKHWLLAPAVVCIFVLYVPNDFSNHKCSI